MELLAAKLMTLMKAGARYGKVETMMKNFTERVRVLKE
jgi:hypothetical protein